MARISIPVYMDEETRNQFKLLVKAQKRTMSAALELFVEESIKKAKKQGLEL